MRKLNKLSQQQVADMLYINRTTYTKYETNKSEPPLDVIYKLAKIFNCDFNTMFSNQNELEKRKIHYFHTNKKFYKSVQKSLDLDRDTINRIEKINENI